MLVYNICDAVAGSLLVASIAVSPVMVAVVDSD
jgi:hypothetical protein